MSFRIKQTHDLLKSEADLQAKEEKQNRMLATFAENDRKQNEGKRQQDGKNNLNTHPTPKPTTGHSIKITSAAQADCM